MWLWWCVMVSVAVSVGWSEAARVLSVLPVPVNSHHRVMAPVLRALARAGHHVTCYTPYPDPDPPPNFLQVHVKQTLAALREKVGEREGEDPVRQFKSPWGKLKNTIYMREGSFAATHDFLRSPEFQSLLHTTETFDVIIISASALSEPLAALQHRFGALLVQIVPSAGFHGVQWLMGSPYDTSYIVDQFLPYSDQMTLWQRVHNTAHSLAYRALWGLHYLPRYQTLMDQYVRYPGWQRRPSMVDMLANTSLVLINTHPAVTYPHPLSPHFQEIGGVTLEDPQPLPKDIEDFMNGAEHGVIYFSLGSFIQATSVLKDVKEDVSRAFGKLKQRILWKFEDETFNVTSNVMVRPWFPQQSILAHSKLKLFMTQAGALSMLESVRWAVPMLAVPVFADQYKNAKHMEVHGYGATLYPDNVTVNTVLSAVSNILNQPSYKEKAERRRDILMDRRSSPLDDAVYWVEYVLKHRGAPHLRPAIATMSWFQSTLVDVYLIITVITLSLFYLVYTFLRIFLYSLLRILNFGEFKIKTA